LLHLRVHNTLLELVHQGGLGRIPLLDGEYLYVSATAQKAAAQVAAREKQCAAVRSSLRPLELLQVIDVLVAVIHASRADARKIATRLQARGQDVTPEQVEIVFATYAIKKKTRSPSKRWRR